MTTCEPVTEDLEKLSLSKLVEVACSSSRFSPSFEVTQRSSRAISAITRGAWDQAAKAAALSKILKTTDTFEVEEAALHSLLETAYVVSLVEVAAYFYNSWREDGGAGYPARMSDIVGKLSACGVDVNQQLFDDHGFPQVKAKDFLQVAECYRRS